MNSKGQRFAAVCDGHINHISLEIVVINLDTRRQVESITFGWIKTLKEKAKYLQDASEEIDCPSRDEVRLLLDGQQLGGGPQKPVDFECGCCGESFESTYDEQKVYDQDAGYGFCPGCVTQFNLGRQEAQC